MLNDLFAFALQNGLPQSTLLFLLLLPSIAALVIFFRVVIGLDHFNLSRGILLALGVNLVGLTYGIILFFASILLDVIIRKLLEHSRLLPPTKHALSLITIGLVLLGSFMTAGYFGSTDFAALNVISVLLILVSSQSMLHINPGDHPLKPFLWFIGVVFFLYTSFLVFNSWQLHAFIVESPILYGIALLVIILFLARFRSLRLIEFFRFISIISNNKH